MKNWKAGLAILLFAALIAGLLYWQTREDGDITDTAKPTVITREAEVRTLREELTIRGNLERVEQATVKASFAGLVSQVFIDDGDTVASGDSILAIDGRPSIAVDGDIQFFRSLDVGSQGPDVAQLEQVLSDAGYNPGRLDDLYTNETRSALARWQTEQGYAGADFEPGEVITLSLQGNPTGYTIGPQNTASITIDPLLGFDFSAAGESAGLPLAMFAQAGPMVGIVANQVSVIEGNQASFTLNLSAPFAAATPVSLTFAGSAANGVDYNQPAGGQIVVPAGTTSFTFAVNSIGDPLAEPDTVLTISVAAGAGYVAGAPPTATTSLLDDDDPELTISATPTTIVEGATSVVTVTSNAPMPATTTVQLTIGGSATAGTDYPALPGSVVFPVGATSVIIPTSIAPSVDNVIDNGETVTVGLNPVLGLPATPGYSVGPQGSTTVTINEAGGVAVPTLTLDAGATFTNEGGNATFTVTASQASNSAITVNLTLGGTAVGGTDYQVPANIQTTLPAGATTANFTVATIQNTIVEADTTITASLAASPDYLIGTPSSDTIELRDNDEPEINISGTTTITEGSSATLTITADQPSTTPLVISLTPGGTAQQGNDFNPLPSTVTLPAGATSKTITLTSLADNVLEPTEDVVMTIGGGNGFTVGPSPAATVTIVDPNAGATPVVTITPDASSVPEGQTASVTVTSSQATTSALTVNLTFAGTAVAGTDYQLPPNSQVTIPAGQTSVTVPLNTSQDTIVENDPTISVSVGAGTGYVVGTPATADVAIDDDDAPEIEITGSTTIAEGQNATLTITADQSSTGPIVVNLAPSGAAQPSADYVTLPATVTLPAGATSATVNVASLADTVLEPAEDVVVTVASSPSNSYTPGNSSTATVTITDPNSGTAPALSISPDATSVTEGQPATVTITASQATTTAITVDLKLAGSAVVGSDYQAPANNQVVIPAGETSITVPITTIQDTVIEDDSKIKVVLVAGTDYTVGSPSTATIEILDDDAPEVDIEPNEILTEGDSTKIKIKVDQTSPVPIVIGLAVSGSAQPGVDYETLPASVVLPAGKKQVVIDLATLTDSILETSEDIAISVASGSGYVPGSGSTATVTILDADAGDEQIITVTADSTNTPEGQPATITIAASKASTNNTTVNLTFGGTATSGGDYTPPANLEVILPAGQTSVTVPITTIQDDDIEADETLSVTATSGTGYIVGAPSTATVEILDDDLPELRIGPDTTVLEGASTSLTITADQAATEDIKINLSPSGIAQADSDYEPISTSVTLLAGRTEVVVPVAALTDVLLEDDEELVISIGSGNGYQLSSVASATVTIIDSGAKAPTLTVSSSAQRTIEGSSVVFTIDATVPSSRDVDIDIALGGSAARNVDYTFPTEDLVLRAGQSNITITAQIRQDDIIEGDKTISLSLVAGGGAYAIGSPSSASTIIEDDDLPELSLRGGNVVVAEGGSAAFIIEADQAPAKDTSVNYSVNPGSAQPGIDFETISGTAVLPAGQRILSIPLVTLDDDVAFRPTDMITGDWPSRIGTISVEEGERIAEGAALIEITEDEFTVRLTASPTDRSELSVGQVVEVEIEAGNQETTGVISELDDNATASDGGGETYEGRVEIDQELVAVDGANVTITVVIEEAANATTVPVAAVLAGPDGDEVRVLNLDTEEVVRVQVETGLEEGSFVAITGDVEAGDLIVIEIEDT